MDKKYVCVVTLFIGLCHGVSPASECSARGRFPNQETNDCRGYTMCLMGGLTNFTQYKLTCPAGAVYSHLEEQCTNATSYRCYSTYNCTGVGNFASPESDDCSSFVACIEGLDGLSTARLVECAPNMLFNSTAGVCVNDTDFTCPSVIPAVDAVVDPANNAINTNINFYWLFSVLMYFCMNHNLNN